MSVVHFQLPCIAAVTLAVLSACTSTVSSAIAPRLDLLGTPAADHGPSIPTITITAATRWVDVTSGTQVRFVVGERAFAWHFQVSPQVATFDLNLVAPPGLLSRRIPVYVTPNPLYGSGG